MVTDYLTLLPVKDISIGHGITPTTSTDAYSVLIDKSDETFITAQYDETTSTEFTYASTFEMGAKELPQALQINVTSCILSFRSIALYHATGAHDITFYIDGTQISTISLTDATAGLSGTTYEVFSTQNNEVTELTSAINNYLISNNYTALPTITFELASKVACTSVVTMSSYDDAEISEVQLKINYETEDENSVLHRRICLRPCADISIEHTLYPSDSTNAYLLVNEEVADDGSTYIECKYESTNVEKNATSLFKMTQPEVNTNIEIIGIKFYTKLAAIKGASNTTEVSISVNNITASTGAVAPSNTTSVMNYELEELEFTNATNLLNEINSYIKINGSFPDMTLTLISKVLYSGKGTYTSSVSQYSQIYLELEYIEEADMGIHIKSNGSWLPATQAFQKVSGTWIEITADECKTILQSI